MKLVLVDQELVKTAREPRKQATLLPRAIGVLAQTSNNAAGARNIGVYDSGYQVTKRWGSWRQRPRREC